MLFQPLDTPPSSFSENRACGKQADDKQRGFGDGCFHFLFGDWLLSGLWLILKNPKPCARLGSSVCFGSSVCSDLFSVLVYFY